MIVLQSCKCIKIDQEGFSTWGSLGSWPEGPRVGELSRNRLYPGVKMTSSVLSE